MLPWSIILPAPFDDGPGAAGGLTLVAGPGAPDPVVYRAGAIIRDLLCGADGLWDLSRSDAAWAADEVAIAQQIRLRLLTWKGERFDDYDLGIDYSGVVFAVGATTTQIGNEFRTAILGVPGVRSVLKLAVTVASSVATVTWTVDTDLGALSGSTVVNGGA